MVTLHLNVLIIFMPRLTLPFPSFKISECSSANSLGAVFPSESDGKPALAAALTFSRSKFTCAEFDSAATKAAVQAVNGTHQLCVTGRHRLK